MNDLDRIAQEFYAALPDKCARMRKMLGRPLTLAEKILASHVTDLAAQEFTRGTSYL